MISSLRAKSLNLEAMFRKWRELPWVAAQELLGCDLPPFQQIRLRSLWQHNTHIDVAGRGSGKTYTAAVGAVLRAMLYPGNRVGLIGPSYRQSRYIFEEIERLYDRSPVFREAAPDGPKYTPEKCYIKFASAEGYTGSAIEALPLGSDGGKIRGARYFDVFVDEVAQVDNDILNIVVRGFMATSANPMERVRLIEEQDKLIREGKLDAASGLITGSTNKFYLCSTAYYTYNHLWTRVSSVIDQTFAEKQRLIRAGKPHDHILVQGSALNDGQIPARVLSDGKTGLTAFIWSDIPKGFMNVESITQSRKEMVEQHWRMEYECVLQGTLVTTDRGARPIEDIKVGDMVLTHRGRFRRVTEVMRRNYSGPVHRIRTYGSDAEVHITANHPAWRGGEQWAPIADAGNELHLARLGELSGLSSLLVDEWVGGVLFSSLNGCDFVHPRPSGSDNGQDSPSLERRGDKWLARYKDHHGRTRAKTLAIAKGATEREARAAMVAACEGLHVAQGKRVIRKRFKSSIPRQVALNHEFGLILGWYASEGSVGARGRQVCFSLDGHHDATCESFVKELTDAIRKVFGISPKVKQSADQNLTNVMINSRIVADLLSRLCPGTAPTKQIDPSILFSNPELMRGFLTGYWHGDGCWNEKPSMSAGSVSLALLSQAKMALGYFGFASGLRRSMDHRTSTIDGKECQCLPVYELSVKGSRAKDLRRFMADGHLVVDRPGVRRLTWCDHEKQNAKVRSNNVYDYRGEVFNLEVEEDHSYSLASMTVHNCLFPSDSDGFFKRSLLDSARKHNSFGPRVGPVAGMKYVMGVDPARVHDNFAIAIFEIDPKMLVIRLVRVYAFNKRSWPEMAMRVRAIAREWDVDLMAMDSEGGGSNIRDLLARREFCPAGEQLILERDFDEHRMLVGKRILMPLCKFANAQWIHDANHTLRTGLEQGQLLIAAKPPVPGEIIVPIQDELDEEIEATLQEVASIVTTELQNRTRWDTPTSGMRKDRYSAVLMGYWAARHVLDQIHRPTQLVTGFWA